MYRLSVLSAQSQLLLQSPIINLDWAGSQLAVRGGPDIAIISGLIHRILASFISGRAASFWPGLSCELQMNYVIMDLLGCSPMSGSRPPPLYSFLLSQLRWREREREDCYCCANTGKPLTTEHCMIVTLLPVYPPLSLVIILPLKILQSFTIILFSIISCCRRNRKENATLWITCDVWLTIPQDEQVVSYECITPTVSHLHGV